MADNFEIGEKEKHIITATTNWETKFINIDFDKQSMVSDWHPSHFSKNLHFDVGTSEIHRGESPLAHSLGLKSWWTEGHPNPLRDPKLPSGVAAPSPIEGRLTIPTIGSGRPLEYAPSLCQGTPFRRWSC
jgi:hypothetical protein